MGMSQWWKVAPTWKPEDAQPPKRPAKVEGVSSLDREVEEVAAAYRSITNDSVRLAIRRLIAAAAK
jgi:hypothetical protein